MDIEEFVKQHQPRGKRSRLEPFKTEIVQLRSKGYAIWQINEWLSSKGIRVCDETVRKFIEKNSGSNTQPNQESRTGIEGESTEISRAQETPKKIAEKPTRGFNYNPMGKSKDELI